MFTRGFPSHGVWYTKWLVPRRRGDPKKSSHIWVRRENRLPLGFLRSSRIAAWRSFALEVFRLELFHR